ncbi:hypothetical protein HaLaN_32359 [Haematococcus lacustris]|uniref:Uncharacterized protein n=1 Tax=Haematococcus lacustris TaxID=44745 RepID=A0A6A0AKG3_HAELA|nr:hypothetical protein HaLaN_32359 [Haematococcus lacustris]
MLARFVEEVQCNSAVLKLCSAKQVVLDELLKHVAQHLHGSPHYLAAVSDITDPCVEGVGPDQARSEHARLAGNAAYKQGQLLETLLHYNALQEADCAVRADPTSYKARCHTTLTFHAGAGGRRPEH